MVAEITTTKFTNEAYQEFRNRLDLETALLQQWISDGRMHRDQPTVGCELEAWLVDDKGNPSPKNVEFLNSFDDEMVIPEL